MVEQATSYQTTPPAFPQVAVPGAGVISLATLDEVRDARHAGRASADHLDQQATELEELAEDWMAHAGALLVRRRHWADAPQELAPQLLEAERLVARISTLDERAASQERTGEAPATGRSVVARLLGWGGVIVRMQRAAAVARLRRTLLSIAHAVAASPALAVPELEPRLEYATELDARAAGLRGALDSVAPRLVALDVEIQVREEAERKMGIDALLLAARFHTGGLAEVPSPIELDAGEVAHLAVDAALARMPAGSRHEPSGSGSDVSTAHTGLLSWVGNLRNHPAPGHGMSRIDIGALVLTSRRLLFVGSTEAVAISLDLVIDVDVFTDGLAVLQLGRESPDLFLVTAPRPVVLYLNYALSAAQCG
ncbi:MAG TPA: hypothetical protein VGO86_14700 [Candidatus Dormibacteraeota bacterium]